MFTRGYREREQARQKDLPTEGELRVRKIAITVPNATRKESEEQQRDEEDKEEMMPGITSSSDALVKEEAMEDVAQQEEVCDEMVPGRSIFSSFHFLFSVKDNEYISKCLLIVYIIKVIYKECCSCIQLAKNVIESWIRIKN